MSEQGTTENTNTGPATDQQEGAGTESRGNRKRRIAVIVAVVVFLLVVAAVVAGVLVTRERHTVALEDCARSGKAYETSVADLKRNQEQAQKVLAATPAQNTADPKTHASLEQTALEKADRTTVSCAASQSTTELNRNKDRLDKAASVNKRLARLNKDAAARVEASAKTKTLSDEKQSLDASISAAAALLGDSEGKVADSAVRESLSKALDDARQVSGKKDITDPKTYTDAKQALDGAVNAVNDSIGQKQAADEAAVAEAYSASGAGSAYTGSGSTRNGYASGGYSGGGYMRSGTSGSTPWGIHADSSTSIAANPGSPDDTYVEFETCGILGSDPHVC
nr:hypothetical protein [Bifidobacterium indicum]